MPDASEALPLAKANAPKAPGDERQTHTHSHRALKMLFIMYKDNEHECLTSDCKSRENLDERRLNESTEKYI